MTRLSSFLFFGDCSCPKLLALNHQRRSGRFVPDAVCPLFDLTVQPADPFHYPTVPGTGGLIAELPIRSYIPAAQNRIEQSWHDEQAVPIFRFTAGVFRRGWLKALPCLGRLFARPSCIISAVAKSFLGCSNRSCFNRFAACWEWACIPPALTPAR